LRLLLLLLARLFPRLLVPRSADLVKHVSSHMCGPSLLVDVHPEFRGGQPGVGRVRAVERGVELARAATAAAAAATVATAWRRRAAIILKPRSRPLGFPPERQARQKACMGRASQKLLERNDGQAG